MFLRAGGGEFVKFVKTGAKSQPQIHQAHENGPDRGLRP